MKNALYLLLFLSLILPPGVKATSFKQISPIPLSVNIDKRKARLGAILFNDVRLSLDNTISCANCHNLENGGSDNLAKSIGIKGKIGNINAPTVFNSGFNFVQFWDGRARTLEEQVHGPVNDPAELGSNWDQILLKLKKDEVLNKKFSTVFSEGITVSTLIESIASFEQALITPNSRFDQFLRGDLNAITEREKQGFDLFKNYGCISCHQGKLVGGNMYEKMGIINDYFATRGDLTEVDYGRYNQTGKEEDRFEFKVPSLRLVALTPPYFHDGKIKTLEKAVKAMARFQLGRAMPNSDVQLIVEFLKTLAGDLDAYKDILNDH